MWWLRLKKHIKRLLSLGSRNRWERPAENLQCPESPFSLSLPGMNLVVLPSSEIETIKALPESEVSIK